MKRNTLFTIFLIILLLIVLVLKCSVIDDMIGLYESNAIVRAIRIMV